jgi:ribosomal protein S18 acetylase RimI-like enzyme
MNAIAAPPVTIRPAETAEDIEAVRVIRNNGREWMTGDTSEIDAERQAEFWRSLDPSLVRLYVAELDGAVVGYGLLRQPLYGAWWVSLAVAPDHRGRGIGAELYARLAELAGTYVWAEIRRDNIASQRAAEKAGYSRAGSTEGGLLYVRYPK